MKFYFVWKPDICTPIWRVVYWKTGIMSANRQWSRILCYKRYQIHSIVSSVQWLAVIQSSLFNPHARVPVQQWATQTRRVHNGSNPFVQLERWLLFRGVDRSERCPVRHRLTPALCIRIQLSTEGATSWFDAAAAMQQHTAAGDAAAATLTSHYEAPWHNSARIVRWKTMSTANNSNEYLIFGNISYQLRHRSTGSWSTQRRPAGSCVTKAMAAVFAAMHCRPLKTPLWRVSE